MEIRNQPNRPRVPNSDTRQRGAPQSPPTGEEPERINQREVSKRAQNVRQTIKQHEEISQRARNVRQTIQAQEAADRIQNAREAALARRLQNARQSQQASEGRTERTGASDRVDLSPGARALSIDESELAAREEQVKALTAQFREGRLMTEERIQTAAEKLLGRDEA